MTEMAECPRCGSPFTEVGELQCVLCTENNGYVPSEVASAYYLAPLWPTNAVPGLSESSKHMGKLAAAAAVSSATSKDAVLRLFRLWGIDFDAALEGPPSTSADRRNL